MEPYGIVVFNIILGFGLMVLLNYVPNVEMRKDKKNRLEEVIVILGNDCYHLHHYILFLLFMLVLMLGRYGSNKVLLILISLGIGSILEDLLFSDWTKIKGDCEFPK